MSKTKLRTSIQNLIIEMLKDYPHIDEYIHDRELDLRYPDIPRDENVGGSRGSRKSPDGAILNMIVTINEDERLNALKRQKRAIEDSLDDSEETTRQLIDLLYFHRRKPTVQTLVETREVPLALRTAYDKRNDFFVKVAQRLHLDVY